MSPRNKEQNQQIRDERREEILRAALEVFGRKGLVAASERRPVGVGILKKRR